MTYDSFKTKKTLNQSISNVTADLTSYVTKPGKDFSRVRKLSPDEVISYLISQGASSTKCEWLDFFQLSSETPSVSALNQRYQYVAADGSTISFFSFPRFASEDYFISEGHSARGFYSMHINAFFDLDTKTIKIKDGFYRRFVDCSASFDYITYGSLDTYDLKFRIVRFPISVLHNTFR